MPRRTKIIATLGPATDEPGVLDDLIAAGVSVVRLNFSHGDADAHRQRAAAVRAAGKRQGRDVAVLADLQGPQIRIRGFGAGLVDLEEGAAFCLDPALPADAGTAEAVGITYESLARDVSVGDCLLLADGQVALRVEHVDGGRIHCRVTLGGTLSNNKGINRLGGGLSAPALTDKDREDIGVITAMEVDYVAVSFPKSAAEIHEARTLLEAAGSPAGVVAKIERAEAVGAIDGIIRAADAVMVARGDLGVEIGDEELPGVQKRIIAESRSGNRAVITAAQMMDSMISNPTPTRAEVMDVANAVIDGTDAVMLSAETAIGAYPVRTAAAVARICEGAERKEADQVSDYRLHTRFGRIDEAVAMAAMYTANHLNVAAIVALTESGATALWMSRISSRIPIYALTQHEITRRRSALYRGVVPVAFDVLHHDAGRVVQDAVDRLRSAGHVQHGDQVIVTNGDFAGIPGGTNALKIITA
ncbi:MAG: pyruvate kinase [Ectothiorhodospiraceae bacterium]